MASFTYHAVERVALLLQRSWGQTPTVAAVPTILPETTEVTAPGALWKREPTANANEEALSAFSLHIYPLYHWPSHLNQALYSGMFLVFRWEHFLDCNLLAGAMST